MKILNGNNRGIAEAEKILSAGGVVAFPTETVYGLGAISTSDEAVDKVFRVKNRPKFNPLIIHVENIEMAVKLCDFSKKAFFLAKKFWPGPLTIIGKKRKNINISTLATAGLDTIAVRVPRDRIAQELIKCVGVPIAAPSANISGKLSCTTTEDIREKLSKRIDGIILGAQCELGLESTVIDCSSDSCNLIRLGSLPFEELKDFLNIKQLTHFNSGNKVKSPGQLLSHYSPDSKILLNEKSPNGDDLYLGFGSYREGIMGLNLSESGNLREAARNLFSFLHQLDRASKNLGGKTIKVAPIPYKGLGLSINDRLERASKLKKN